MTRILVLYYSMHGHIEIMAKAIAEGVLSTMLFYTDRYILAKQPTTMSKEPKS